MVNTVVTLSISSCIRPALTLLLCTSRCGGKETPNFFMELLRCSIEICWPARHKRLRFRFWREATCASAGLVRQRRLRWNCGRGSTCLLPSSPSPSSPPSSSACSESGCSTEPVAGKQGSARATATRGKGRGTHRFPRLSHCAGGILASAANGGCLLASGGCDSRSAHRSADRPSPAG